MTEEITKQNTLVPDAVAGLTTGIANIPDAMASAILAGVNSSDIMGDSTITVLVAAQEWLDQAAAQQVIDNGESQRDSERES